MEKLLYKYNLIVVPMHIQGYLKVKFGTKISISLSVPHTTCCDSTSREFTGSLLFARRLETSNFPRVTVLDNHGLDELWVEPCVVCEE